MKRIALLLILCALATFLCAEETQDFNGRYQINKIHIDTLDAFDPRIPEYGSWPFRFLNRIHNRTNDSFIRRELLFREGELLDYDLIAESERNLRRHSFLDDVRIDSKVIGSGKVDLYVHTEDQWTTQVDLSFGKSSGFSTFQFAIEESNFLGLGKTISLGYRRDPERTRWGALYFDPQFLNSRWTFETSYETASDGWRYTNDVIRPFYSLDTKWAYGVSWDSGIFAEKLHYKGETVAEIDTDHRSGLFFAARSWGSRYNHRRFGMLFSADSLLYPNPARIILPEAVAIKSIRKNLHPTDREDYQYGVIFNWDRQQFIKKSYLDNFGRIEDLPQGLLLATTFTRSQDVKPNPDFYQIQSVAQYTKQVSSWQYLSLLSEFSIRRQTDGRFSNAIFNGFSHYYLQMPEFRLGPIRFPRQTLATNLSATLTRDVDPPFQLSLGENEGLRGYTFKYFNGQNRVLMNIEDRIFTPLNYRLVGIGFVGFLDAGYVWSGDEHLKFNDFPISVGVGLRIALKKAQSAKVIRVDFAVPLTRQTSPFASIDAKGYSISVSSGQVFEVLGDLPKLFRLF